MTESQPLQTRVLQSIEETSVRTSARLTVDGKAVASKIESKSMEKFFKRQEIATVVLCEARKVLSSLRRSPRFSQPGTSDLTNGSVYLLGSTFTGVTKNEEETRLVKNIKLLRNLFAGENWPRESRVVFKTFVDLLRTEDVPSGILVTVLSSLNRFVVYRIPTFLVELSETESWQEVAKFIEELAETASGFRLQGFDTVDDIIMSRVCELMANCITSPEGEYLSNETIVHCIETFLRVCSPRGKKRSDVLRKTAESYLKLVIQHIFSRVSSLNDDGRIGSANVMDSEAASSQWRHDISRCTDSQGRKEEGSTNESFTYLNPPHVSYNYRCLAWFLSLGARMVDPVVTQNTEERLLGLQLLETCFISAPKGSLAKVRSLRKMLVRDVCRAVLRCLGMLSDPSTVMTASFNTVLCLIDSLGPYSTPLVEMILVRFVRTFLYGEETEEGNGNFASSCISPVTREIVLDALGTLLQREGFLSAAYAVLDCQLNEPDAVQPLLEALSDEAILTADGKMSTSGRICYEIFSACMDTLAVPTDVPDDSDIDQLFGRVNRCANISVEQLRAKKQLKRKIDKLVTEFNAKGLSIGGTEIVELIHEHGLLSEIIKLSQSLTEPVSSSSPSSSRTSPKRAAVFSNSADDDIIVRVAHFLRFTPGLNKTAIGSCLGEPDVVSMKILAHYVGLFDFKNRSFTSALRIFLESFRLPGEAQKIDRILQSFSEHYFNENKTSTPFHSADAVHVLAFASVMLNTDQHNASIKKKMTMEEFIANSRGINDGHDLPREFLRDVYASISSVEIKMSDEAGLAALTEDHWDEVLRKIGIDPESGESNNMVAFSSPAKAKEFDKDVFLIAWQPVLKATCRALSAAKDGDEVQSSIEGFLGIARLAAVFRLSEPVDEVMVGLSVASKLLDGTLSQALLSFGLNINCQMAAVALFGIARQCGDCLRETGWTALLTCVIRLHVLKILPASLEQSLFGDGEEVVDPDGRALPCSDLIPPWWPGYLDSNHSSGNSTRSYSSTHSESNNSSPGAVGKLSSVLSAFGGFFGFGADDSSDEELGDNSLYIHVPDFITRSTPEEKEAEKLAKKCINDCRIEDIVINDSRFLHGESIAALMKCICKMIVRFSTCQREFLGGQETEDKGNLNSLQRERTAASSRSSRESDKLTEITIQTKDEFAARECAISFCVDLVREIILRNRDRLSLLWPYCHEILETILCSTIQPSPSSERATITLLRIAIRYGHREELRDDVFRSLNLFVKLDQRAFESVSERIAAGLYHICRLHAALIKSTSVWHILLSLLESMAHCSSPTNVIGFETIEFLLKEPKHRHCITHQTFSPWLHAVLAYTEAPTPIAVRTIECLGLLASLLPNILKEYKSSFHDMGMNESQQSYDASLSPHLYEYRSKVWKEFWSSLLNAYCCLCVDERTEVRNHAFLSFEKLLTVAEQLQDFSANEWKSLFYDLLLPLASDLIAQRKYVNVRDAPDKLTRKVQAKVPTLVSKLFLLHHITLLQRLSSEEFAELWLKVLSNMNWILQQKQDDEMLADQVYEATKNLVLVLFADGTICPDQNKDSLWKKTLQAVTTIVPDIESHLRQRSRAHSMNAPAEATDTSEN